MILIDLAVQFVALCFFFSVIGMMLKSLIVILPLIFLFASMFGVLIALK